MAHDADPLLERLAGELSQFASVPDPVDPAPVPAELVHLVAGAANRAQSSLLITDADLDEPGPRIVWANKAFERMTGYTSAEVIGRNPRILQGPDTDRTVTRRLRDQLDAGLGFEGEAINYRADGTPFVMSWRIDPIETDGVVTHYIAVQDDVTQLRLRELDDTLMIADLQRALLPALPTSVGRFEVGNAYVPAGTGPVGGDWCDVIAPDPDGAMLAVVGDVTGHGGAAITAMCQLRWATQFAHLGVFSLSYAIPAIRRMARMEPVYATLVLMRIDSDGTMEYLSAGHPPALIIGPGGDIRELPPTTPMIGLATSEHAQPIRDDRLAPGEVLVAYTDGLIERRGSDFAADVARLRHEIARLDLRSGTAPEVAARLIDVMCADHEREDDVAVLVIRHPA